MWYVYLVAFLITLLLIEMFQAFTIEYMLKLGAPSEKLVVGLPLYGRTFLLPEPVLSSSVRKPRLGAVAQNVGFQGPFTRESGFMGYNEVKLLQYIIFSINLYVFADLFGTEKHLSWLDEILGRRNENPICGARK